MSHAKNLVEYGFIGINFSGERLEVFSAPIQFFVYTFLYLIFGINYSAYAKIQTFICTFALGVIFTLFFQEKKYFALISTSISAFGLTHLSSFVKWHGSGMENAITHVLF